MTRRICTICARGGSKGVPNKNIRNLLGRPLIGHSIIQARSSGLFDAIAVSSDADEILNVAQSFGVDVCIKRPDALASDTSGKVPAIAHCLSEAERMLGFECKVLVDLDVTSPLRSVEDIAGVVEKLETEDVSNIITGSVSRRSPYFNLVEFSASGVVQLSKKLSEPIVRRQDAPICFDMNASIYAWKRDVFVSNPQVFYNDTRLFEMPEDRSHDIDTVLDFEWVEFLMQRRYR